METEHFDNLIPLSGPNHAVFFSATSSDGNPVVLERLASPEHESDPLLAALRRKVVTRLERCDGWSVVAWNGDLWVRHPAADASFVSVLDRPPQSISEVLVLARSLMELIGSLHQSGLILSVLDPSSVFQEQNGERSMVSLERSLPFRFGASRPQPHWDGAAEMELDRLPDARIDIYLAGRLMQGLMENVGRTEERSLREHLTRVASTMAAREPEDRYQSARSVLEELGRIDAGGEPVLARHVGLDVPFISRMLVGREAELSRLSEALQNGRPSLVIVSGDPGVGKTSLCTAALERARLSRSQILTGSFESEAGHAPLAALVEAAERYIWNRHVDGQDSDRISTLVSLSRPAVRALSSVSTAIAVALDESEHPRESGYPRRLGSALEELLLAISTERTVLFIDRCEKADAATFGILRTLVRRRIPGLTILLAGTQLPTIDEPDHLHLALAPLTHSECATIIADSTGINPDRVLDSLEFRDSVVTPREIVQLLGSGEGRQSIVPSANGFRLVGSITVGINDRRVGPHPIDDSLPTGSIARTMAQIGSVVGGPLDFSLLHQLQQGSSSETAEALLDAIDAGVVAAEYDGRSVGRIRFANASIRAAIYEQLSEEQKSELHRRVADALEVLGAEWSPGWMFEVAEHAARAGGEDSQSYFKRQFRAGVAAENAGADEIACIYFDRAWSATGSTLDPPPEALLRLIRTLISAGREDEAEDLLNRLSLDHADSQTVAEAEELRYRLIVRTAPERVLDGRSEGGKRYEAHYQALRQFLRRFGVRLPARPSRIKALLGVIFAGTTRLPEERVDQPAPLSSVLEALISHATFLAFIMDPMLSLSVCLAIVRFMKRRPDTIAAPVSLSFLAALLCGTAANPSAGRHYSERAQRALQDTSRFEARCRSLFFLNGSALTYYHPYAELDDGLEESRLLARDVGDRVIEIAALFVRLLHRFFAGQNLHALADEVRAHVSPGRIESDHDAAMQSLLQVTENLLSRAESPWLLRGPHYDSKGAEATDYLETPARITSAIAAFAYGRLDVVASLLPLSWSQMAGVSAMPTGILHDFLTAISATAVGHRRNTRGLMRRKLFGAAQSRANYGCYFHYLVAEEARARGLMERARTEYEEGVDAAQEARCPHAVAAGFSRLASLADEAGRHHLSELMRTQADEARESWLSRTEQPPEAPPAERPEQGRSYLAEIDVDAAITTLRNAMESEMIYLQSGLKLGELADAIGLSVHQLSELLNRYLHSGFSGYINGYRVRHASGLIERDPSQSLLEIAYDSGFNSKTAFNQAFKQVTGMTPSQFRRSRSQE